LCLDGADRAGGGLRRCRRHGRMIPPLGAGIGGVTPMFGRRNRPVI
jgi:hypothetical protein